jgi:hypothetical protein
MPARYQTNVKNIWRKDVKNMENKKSAKAYAILTT